MFKFIVKKIFGAVFVLVGAVLALSLLVQIYGLLGSENTEIESEGYEIAFILGQIIGVLIMALIVFFLFKFGFKWLSKKRELKEMDTIDAIGKN